MQSQNELLLHVDESAMNEFMRIQADQREVSMLEKGYPNPLGIGKMRLTR